MALPDRDAWRTDAELASRRVVLVAAADFPARVGCVQLRDDRPHHQEAADEESEGESGADHGVERGLARPLCIYAGDLG